MEKVNLHEMLYTFTMSYEKFFQDLDETDQRSYRAWYAKRAQEALTQFDYLQHSKDILIDGELPTIEPNLWALTQNGFFETFQDVIRQAGYRENHGKLIYTFPNQHKGYILETGGVALLRPQDEAIFPSVQYCYLVAATMKYRDQKVLAVMHHGPQWKQIPFLLQAFNDHGKVDAVTLVGNGVYEEGDNDAKKVAEQITQEINIPIQGYSLIDHRWVFHLLLRDQKLHAYIPDSRITDYEEMRLIPSALPTIDLT